MRNEAHIKLFTAPSFVAEVIRRHKKDNSKSHSHNHQLTFLLLLFHKFCVRISDFLHER